MSLVGSIADDGDGFASAVAGVVSAGFSCAEADCCAGAAAGFGLALTCFGATTAWGAGFGSGTDDGARLAYRRGIGAGGRGGPRRASITRGGGPTGPYVAVRSSLA